MKKPDRKENLGLQFKQFSFVRSFKIKKPSLERFGIWYFKKLGRKHHILEEEQEVHVLDETEHKALAKIERGAILRSALAGAFSAAVAAYTAVVLYPLIDEVNGPIPWENLVEYWLVVGSVTFVITMLEIAYIYYDSLRSVYKIATVAKIPLFDQNESASVMAYSLARAAMELPNPLSSDFDIDPNRESPRWKVILSPFIYKLKIAFTNFIAKLLVRRMVGRAAARIYIEFIAVPISAIWNAIVSYRVLRQARIRALGPSFALDFITSMLERKSDFSLAAQQEMLRAIGTAVVRSENLHPNLEYMLLILSAKFDLANEEELDNSELFHANFEKLERNEQFYVLQVYLIASVIDGVYKPREVSLVKDIYKTAGYQYNADDISLLSKKFYSGAPIEIPVVPLKDLEANT